jgi:hypothetical protein
VNIKSITTVPLKETKKVIDTINSDSIEVEKPKAHKLWYAVGIILIIGGICFTL